MAGVEGAAGGAGAQLVREWEAQQRSINEQEETARQQRREEQRRRRAVADAQAREWDRQAARAA